MINIFRNFFLSKKGQQIVDTFNEINKIKKSTNNYIKAQIRFLEELNQEYLLGFSVEQIVNIPNTIMPSLVKVGLSYNNANYVFSQFVNLYIISNGNSAKYRYSYDDIYNIAQNVDKLLIPYKTWIYPELKYKIDENLDVIKLLGYKPNKKSRDISLHILAAEIGCSIDNYKQKLFEQLDKMNPDLDKLVDLSIKNADLKEEQSDKLNIHPNDTPAKIMMELLDEYCVIHKDKLERKDQIFRETIKEAIELAKQNGKVINDIEIFGINHQLKTRPINNDKERLISKTILALKIGCSIQNLKVKVFEQFDSVDVSIDEFKKLKPKYNLTKSEHALKYNMHPNNTPAAIMIEMLEEYYNTTQNSDHWLS